MTFSRQTDFLRVKERLLYYHLNTSNLTHHIVVFYMYLIFLLPEKKFDIFNQRFYTAWIEPATHR